MRKLVVHLGVLALLVIFNWMIYPLENLVFPPSKADLLGHYQTFLNLKKSGSFGPFWNPYNGLGEFSLLNYFPFPFYLMILFSFIFENTMAFNLVCFLPVILFPYFVFCSFKGRSSSLYTGCYSMLFSLSVLYSLSIHPWGGTANGVFIGQFCHMYALCFLVLFRVLFKKYLDSKLSIVFPAIVACLVMESHILMSPWLPLVCLELILGSVKLKLGFLKMLKTAVLSVLLASHYLIPFIDNLTWVFPVKYRPSFFAYSWDYYLSDLAIFGIAVGIVLSIYLLIRGKVALVLEAGRNWISAGILTLGSVLFLVLFDLFGVTGGRAFYQVKYFLVISVALFLVGFTYGVKEKMVKQSLGALLVLIPLIFLCLKMDKIDGYFVTQYVDPGTYTKLEEYKGLVRELNETRPNRVEGPFLTGDLGNKLKFVMDWSFLPSIVPRSVPSTLYLDQNHISPYWIYLRSIVGYGMLCYPDSMVCPEYEKGYETLVEPMMDFLGVGTLVLPKSQVLDNLLYKTNLKVIGRAGDLSILEGSQKINVVDVIDPSRISIEPMGAEYKKIFMSNFLSDVRKGKFLLLANTSDFKLPKASMKKCSPSVEIGFNRLKLITNCPGQVHRIKFSYNPALTADETIHLISPGFIGFLPKTKETLFRYERKWMWKISDGTSFIVLLGSLGVLLKSRVSRLLN